MKKGMTTMEWLAIVIGIVMLIGFAYVVYNIATAPPQTQIATMAASSLIVVTNCDDKVICYQTGSTWGGMQCFRDADLVARYCDVCHGNPNCAPTSPTIPEEVTRCCADNNCTDYIHTKITDGLVNTFCTGKHYEHMCACYIV